MVERYKHVKNTILDDFIISLGVGRIFYTIWPEAYAIETASVNVKEEFKRKIKFRQENSINRTVAFIY
jgi:hypothetical protein